MHRMPHSRISKVGTHEAVYICCCAVVAKPEPADPQHWLNDAVHVVVSLLLVACRRHVVVHAFIYTVVAARSRI